MENNKDPGDVIAEVLSDFLDYIKRANQKTGSKMPKKPSQKVIMTKAYPKPLKKWKKTLKK